MQAKSTLLRECRRVAHSNARMGFSVISSTSGLSAKAHRLAIEAGPPLVDISVDYAELLHEAGWHLLERLDVTAEYSQSVKIYLAEIKAHAEVLVEVFGADEYHSRLQRRQNTFGALDAGLLMREIFVTEITRTSRANHVQHYNHLTEWHTCQNSACA